MEKCPRVVTGKAGYKTGSQGGRCSVCEELAVHQILTVIILEGGVVDDFRLLLCFCFSYIFPVNMY